MFAVACTDSPPIRTPGVLVQVRRRGRSPSCASARASCRRRTWPRRSGWRSTSGARCPTGRSPPLVAPRYTIVRGGLTKKVQAALAGTPTPCGSAPAKSARRLRPCRSSVSPSRPSPDRFAVVGPLDSDKRTGPRASSARHDRQPAADAAAVAVATAVLLTSARVGADAHARRLDRPGQGRLRRARRVRPPSGCWSR